jgi:hypothetical protein
MDLSDASKKKIPRDKTGDRSRCRKGTHLKTFDPKEGQLTAK